MWVINQELENLWVDSEITMTENLAKNHVEVREETNGRKGGSFHRFIAHLLHHHSISPMNQSMT